MIRTAIAFTFTAHNRLCKAIIFTWRHFINNQVISSTFSIHGAHGVGSRYSCRESREGPSSTKPYTAWGRRWGVVLMLILDMGTGGLIGTGITSTITMQRSTRHMIHWRCKFAESWKPSEWRMLRIIHILCSVSIVGPTLRWGARGWCCRSSLWHGSTKYRQIVGRQKRRVIWLGGLSTGTSRSTSLRRSFETKLLTGLRKHKQWLTLKILPLRCWCQLRCPWWDLALRVVIFRPIRRSHRVDLLSLHSCVKVPGWQLWIAFSLDVLKVVELLKSPPTTFSSVQRVSWSRPRFYKVTWSEWHRTAGKKKKKLTTRRCTFCIKKLVSSWSFHRWWNNITHGSTGSRFTVMDTFALWRHEGMFEQWLWA